VTWIGAVEDTASQAVVGHARVSGYIAVRRGAVVFEAGYPIGERATWRWCRMPTP